MLKDSEGKPIKTHPPYVKKHDGETSKELKLRKSLEEYFAIIGHGYRTKWFKRCFKNKYFPHQGKQEMERRRKRNESRTT